MKQAERLLHILGQVKDEFIEEAAPKERVINRNALWTKWLATAACLVLIMGIAVPGLIVVKRSAGRMEGAAEAPAADAAIEEAAPMEEEAPAAEAPAAEEEDFPSDADCVPESAIITADETSGEKIDLKKLAEKDEWGLALTVKDATSAGATLVFTQSGKQIKGELNFGAMYTIEKQSSTNPDVWTEVEAIGEICWEDVAYIIERGTTREIELNWTGLYGELSEGKYRIVKEVSMYHADASETSLYYAEVVIE